MLVALIILNYWKYSLEMYFTDCTNDWGTGGDVYGSSSTSGPMRAKIRFPLDEDMGRL